MTDPSTQDWEAAERELLNSYSGRVFLITEDDHLIGLFSQLDGQYRLAITVMIDGALPCGFAECADSPEQLQPLARRTLRVRSFKKWPFAKAPTRRKKLLWADLGFDPNARIYQPDPTWRDPKKCLLHLRKHNPGLRLISYNEGYARYLACREAAAAKDASA